MLEVPQDVGGRFTVLSAVGLFGAAMCGINIEEMLAGAKVSFVLGDGDIAGQLRRLSKSDELGA